MKWYFLFIILSLVFLRVVNADFPEIVTREEMVVRISKATEFIKGFSNRYGKRAYNAFSLIVDLETGRPTSFIFTSPETGRQSIFKLLDSGKVERQGLRLKGESIPTPENWVKLELVYNNKNKQVSISNDSRMALEIINDEYRFADPLQDPLAPIKKTNIENIKGRLS